MHQKQQARDDRDQYLDFDTILLRTQQMATTQHPFEHPEKQFDQPSRGNGLQDVTDVNWCVGAEICCPDTIVKTHKQNADNAASQDESRK